MSQPQSSGYFRKKIYVDAGLGMTEINNIMLTMHENNIYFPVGAIIFSYNLDSEKHKIIQKQRTIITSAINQIRELIDSIRKFDSNGKNTINVETANIIRTNAPGARFFTCGQYAPNDDIQPKRKSGMFTTHRLLNCSDKLTKIKNASFLGTEYDCVIKDIFNGITFYIYQAEYQYITPHGVTTIPARDFAFSSEVDATAFHNVLADYVMDRINIVKPVIMDIEKIISDNPRHEMIAFNLTIKNPQPGGVMRNEFNSFGSFGDVGGRNIPRDKDYGKITWIQNRKPILGRGFDSIYLQEKIKENIIHEIDEFFDNETRVFYEKHNINRKKCFLFYGRPGTGKTSIIRAIAETYDLGISTMNLSDANMSDEALKDAFTSIPEDTILVIEEIDTFFTEDKRVRTNTLSLGSLLDSIDGMSDFNNQIIIMTTNNKEKLGDAQSRNGRIDYAVAFDYMNEYQTINMTLAFHHSETQETIKDFTKLYLTKFHNTVPAHLQGIFVKYRKESLASIMDMIKNNRIDNNINVVKNNLITNTPAHIYM